MFYSQLSHSIQYACRGFSRQPYSAFIFGTPIFLMSIPATYGAVVNPNEIQFGLGEHTYSSLNTTKITHPIPSHSSSNYALLYGKSKNSNKKISMQTPQSDVQAFGLGSQTYSSLNTTSTARSISSHNPANGDSVYANTKRKSGNENTNAVYVRTTVPKNANKQQSEGQPLNIGSQTYSSLSTMSNARPTPNHNPTNNAVLYTDTKNSSEKTHESTAKNTVAKVTDAEIQQGLGKLAQFYQKTNDNLDQPNTATGSETDIIDANQSAPVAAPNVFNRQPSSTSQRCEGTWVYPSNLSANSKYSKAINKARQQDGLSTIGGLPLYAQADYAYYDSVSKVELSGDVEVIQNGQLITAEQLFLDLNNGIAGAAGNVLLADAKPKSPSTQSASEKETKKDLGAGLITVANQMAYDTTSNAATARNVAFASIPMQAHGYAGTLNRPSDTRVELDKVMFSTCPPTNRKWQLEAEKINIDTDTGRGKAYDSTFRLGNVPVFYLPYFNFPIDDRRSSGVLTPKVSFDTENGLQVGIPYYLNLAPNIDSTLTTNIYTNRNPMLSGELRYLTNSYGQGKLKTGYLPSDKQYDDKDRTGLFYQHNWESEYIPNLTASAVYNYVSDPQYITDFDDLGLTENSPNLPRRAQVNYYNDTLNAQLKIETFQSLKTTDATGSVIQDKDKPYSRLPQLSINYIIPQSTNFEVTGVSDSAYFKKSIHDSSENEKSGLRLYNEIGASYPIQNAWGYITPKLSLQHLFTAYDEESRIVNNVSKSDNSQTVFAPKVSIDSGLNFYQSGSPFGWFDHTMGGYQLLSPRLKYTYSGYKNQDDIPNFNTRIASFDYDQLFADSWFLGHDRIADTNNLTLGLNYRYIDAMGVTRFDGSIGDQFYLDDVKVALDSTNEAFTQSSSGVAWNSSLQPYRNVWFDFNGALDSSSDLNFVSGQIRYQPTPLSLMNFGVIKRKEDTNTNQEELSALTASTVFPINNNWRVMAQGQFDNLNHKFIDSTIGLGYEDCCYGFSVYARSYYNDLNLENKPTKAVMAEFRINGLGDSSSRLSKVLDNKVLGFEPVDTLWKK